MYTSNTDELTFNLKRAQRKNSHYCKSKYTGINNIKEQKAKLATDCYKKKVIHTV